VFIALVIATILLAGMCGMSASTKFRKREQAVEIIGGVVGVPVRFFPVLGSFLLAGTAGVLVGLWVAPVGVAAAAALVLYFLGAAAGHIRVGDTKHLAMPLPPLLLSVVVLVLRIATM
jgi:hypothetical protein